MLPLAAVIHHNLHCRLTSRLRSVGLWRGRGRCRGQWRGTAC